MLWLEGRTMAHELKMVPSRLMEIESDQIDLPSTSTECLEDGSRIEAIQAQPFVGLPTPPWRL